MSIVVPTQLWVLADSQRNTKSSCVMHIPEHGIYGEYNSTSGTFTNIHAQPEYGTPKKEVLGAAAGWTQVVYTMTPYEMYEDEFKRTGAVTARQGCFELVPFTPFDLELTKAMNKCGLM